MDSTSKANSRRRFLQNTAWLGVVIAGVPVPASGRDDADPFDALPKSVWARARNNGLVMIHRPAPAILSSHASIVSNGEPGKPLVIEGQIFTPNGTTPAAGVTVYAYNTDAEGFYGANHKEYPPRLYGWMKTDAEGRFELHTILPGKYPGMQVPAHVHFTVWGAGYPPQWVDELRFEGDSYLTAAMLSEAAAKGEFGSIRPLNQSADGSFHCRFKSRLQSTTNFN